MAERYRKVYPKLWADRAFLALSAEARVLCLYILSGPQTNRIGLFKFSPGQAAEDLTMPPEVLKADLERVCQSFGWRFDAASRVIWLPSWWRYNPPENINVLAGALKDLAEVPDHPFRDGFEAKLRELPQTFAKGITQGVPKPSGNVPPNVPPKVPPNVSPNVSPNVPGTFPPTSGEPSLERSPIQEQEQEQVQDLSHRAGATPTLPESQHPDKTEAQRTGEFVRWYTHDAYPRLRGKPYVRNDVRDYARAGPLVRAYRDDAQLRRVAEFYLTSDHRDAAKGSRTIGQFAALASWCDEQVAAGAAAEPQEPTRPPPAIAAFLAALQARVSRRDWFTWLKPCQVARDDGEALTLVAPTADHVRYVSTHYAGELTQAGERSGRRVIMTSANEVVA